MKKILLKNMKKLLLLCICVTISITFSYAQAPTPLKDNVSFKHFFDAVLYDNDNSVNRGFFALTLKNYSEEHTYTYTCNSLYICPSDVLDGSGNVI